MTRMKLLSFFFVALVLTSGCGGGAGNRSSGETPDRTDTIREEVVRKISRRVLSGIKLEGSLAAVKRRGILRVALAPDSPLLQHLDPNFNIPTGFNPELVAQIASMLEVKPNITMLDAVPDTISGDYDLIFQPEGGKLCSENSEIRYFYNGRTNEWRTICIADSDPGLTAAIREILIHLNETGIFAQVFKTNVGR